MQKEESSKQGHTNNKATQHMYIHVHVAIHHYADCKLFNSQASVPLIAGQLMIPAQYVPALISQYLALVGLPHSLVALHLLLELRLQLPLGRLPTHHEVRPQRGEAVSTARLGEGGVRGEREGERGGSEGGERGGERGERGGERGGSEGGREGGREGGERGGERGERGGERGKMRGS